MPTMADRAIDVRIPQEKWVVRLRRATHSQPTFVFFPHAGGSPLSLGRLVAALPPSVGVIAVNLPRGGDPGSIPPPRRLTAAVDGVTQGLLSFDEKHDRSDPIRMVLVGNSYGALLAYETARSLIRAAVPLERLVVSGFRSPSVAPRDPPLHRMAPDQLRAELAARFGTLAGEVPDGGWAAIEPALRADLEACDTYRHISSPRLALPIDVLHMANDPSVSMDDLLAWGTVTSGLTRLIRQTFGHFPWATHPDAVAEVLLQLAGGECPDKTARPLPEMAAT